MNRTKRLLFSMLTLLCCCTGVWASSIPGALSGRFTINASGEKVVFSQGNLQYVGTWQFAENQWDCFSTSQYNDHRDLFGWGTGDAPNKVSNNNGDYGTFTDWGTNAITNGGNTKNSGWRTLTKDEWVYLFYSRENAATLFGFGSVNGRNGLIILPDNWTTPEGASFTASTTLGLTNQGSYYHNGNDDNYSHNTYTAEQWAVMESAGAVFLPAAAYRHGVDSNINYTDLGGFYWSSTPSSTDKAYYLNFYYNDLDPQFNEMRYGGRPVRLVRSSLDQDNEGYYLIGSVQDWQDFAAIVNTGTNPAANAKMTADIDLGDDQTHIGDNNDLSYAYRGVFDGQGHKLNVNYYSSSSSTAIEGGYFIAPFRNINGATIKNLAVTGNITGYMHCAGVVGYAVSSNTNLINLINNVTVSANITILNTHGGGFIGHNAYATTTIQDCLFNGTINGKSGGSTVGVFFGWSENSATMSLINCLENGSYTNCSTFTPTSCHGYAVPTVTNCYYAVTGSYPGTHATSTTLADGTTAYKLQNNRGDLVWGQRIGTDPDPVLTNDESYRLCKSKNGGYTNDPAEAYKGLQQDAEGNYLLGSEWDWQNFAELVQTTSTANAKMTADIDLGDDQTMIGNNNSYPYSGIFDGQGYTLTVAYNNNDGGLYVAPFSYINGATIRNLHIAGTIQTSCQNAGFISKYGGTGNVVEKVWSSLTIETNWTSNSGNWECCSGFVGSTLAGSNASLNMKDCLFTGSVVSTSGDQSGCFMGYVDSNCSANVSSCLSLGTYSYARTSNSVTKDRMSIDNSYVKQFPTDIPASMQVTAEQLADGTIAYKLQNHREDLVWGQRIGVDAEPVLTNDESYRVYKSKNGGYTNDPAEAYKGLQQDAEGNYLLGSEWDWQNFAELVQTTSTANAKMTADIDVGTDQTMIPTYRGIFDGQGHTLMVNLTATQDGYGPFLTLDGATIKNLHVTGTITNNSYSSFGGIVGYIGGTVPSTITNCRSSVTLKNTSGDNGSLIGGIVAGTSTTDNSITALNMSDCLFDGKFEGTNNSNSNWSGLVGWIYNTTVEISNSLFAPASVDINGKLYTIYGKTWTFNESGSTLVHLYTTMAGSSSTYTQGTVATTEELADGTTTTALNNGRTGDDAPWVQQGNQPMLATFANAVTLTDETDLTALSAYAGKTCKVTYSRSFTETKSSTVCLPFAFAKGSVGTFYTFTGITHEGSNYEATMTEYTGATLEANTPYLFTPSTTGDVDFSGTYTLPASITAGSTTSGDWTYLGTYETISWTEAPTGIYGFSAQAVGDIQQGQFVKVGEYVRIKPMRCYLKYKNGLANYAGARGMTRAADEPLPETIKVRLIGADGEVTAIGSLQTKTGEVTFDKDAWYSLDGRRIEGKPSAKGIYVNNGKKVIIK